MYSYTWSKTGINYTTGGIYIAPTNTGNCPGADTLILTINHSTHSTTVITACDSLHGRRMAPLILLEEPIFLTHLE